MKPSRDMYDAAFRARCALIALDPDMAALATAPTMKTIGTPVHDLSLDFDALDAVGAGWACSSSVSKKEMIRAQALIARLAA